MTARIGVIGAGYVGLVTGVCLASMGHEVILRDIDERKVAAIEAGEVPIYEPGLAELMATHRERVTVTLSLERLLERSDLIFVAVDTPPTYSGDADLSRVMSVVEELQRTGADARHVLIMKSTVPVGTGERVRAELDARGLGAVGYCSNPEFLKEGAAIADFLKPDRVVVGDFRAEDGDRVAALYEPLGAPILRTSVPSAEMVKYASNAFLATKISFINEIANVCEEVGADVSVVAEGMGLDRRIGPSFLRAGVGFGGSCLVPEETVLVRRDGHVGLRALGDLYDELVGRDGELFPGLVEPEGVEVLSWRPDREVLEFMPVTAATRRSYAGEVLEVRTKMGRRIRCTPDHPWLVAGPTGDGLSVKLAEDLTTDDWVPFALGAPVNVRESQELPSLLEGLDDLDEQRVMVRRIADGSGATRLGEARRLGVDIGRARVATAGSRADMPATIEPTRAFWRVVGLYVAEGHALTGPEYRLLWSFHRTREPHLIEEVVDFWRGLGANARVRRVPTSMTVRVSSRLLAQWWTGPLGLGRTSYTQRLPDQIWEQPWRHKMALLSGLWEGDGSWSLVNGGPSVILEWGTISRELADGVTRLLGDLGFGASMRVGRTAKSTADTYWVRIAGADQIERALELVPRRDRPGVLASIARQSKRIAPTGWRPHGDAGWLRVTGLTSCEYVGDVYSLEVAATHNFVTTNGLITDNCFPKDVAALKQLAGNSGYHFQLLTSVIEVNELQKRRVVGKLKKHLGALEGKVVALLGLAFKPETDDMREASSLVLAARLLAEGARVRGYDPIAAEAARERLSGIELAPSAEAALSGADAGVLVTEWSEILDLDWDAVRATMRRPVLIDGRNALDEAAMRAAGYAYEGIGRAVAR